MTTEHAHLFIEFVKEIIDSNESVFNDYSESNIKTEVRGYVVLIYRRIKGVKFNDPKLNRRYRIYSSFIEDSKSSKGQKRPFVIQGRVQASGDFSVEETLQPYLQELKKKKWIVTHMECRNNPVLGNVYLERNISEKLF